MKLRHASLLAVAAVAVLVAGCTPASGLPDARVVPLTGIDNKCQQLEVRVYQQPGGDWSLDARMIGLMPGSGLPNPDVGVCGTRFPSAVRRLTLNSSTCYVSLLSPPCVRYSTFLGEWLQVSSSSPPEAATVLVGPDPGFCYRVYPDVAQVSCP